MCEAFFEWQPMEASRLRLMPAGTCPSLQGGGEPVWALFVPPPYSGAVSTQLRSARAATDGSRWQLRSRGGAGRASAEECKGTLGCPQQWASGTGVWCWLVNRVRGRAGCAGQGLARHRWCARPGRDRGALFWRLFRRLFRRL